MPCHTCPHRQEKKHSRKYHRSEQKCPTYEKKCDSICPDPNPSCQNKTVNVKRTVFVDAEFGSDDRGQLNSANCPFQTINGAIQALAPRNLTVSTQWNLQISPGNYLEAVKVPVFINLTGAGQNLTFVHSLEFTGTSLVSNLTVQGPVLPLIATQLDSDDPDRNQVGFQNVDIIAADIAETHGSPVIAIRGSGLNNNVTFTHSRINANVSPSNTSAQILFGITAIATLVNVDLFYITQFSASTAVFDLSTDARATIEGGNFELRVAEGPAEEVNFFQINGGALVLNGNQSTIIILQIAHPYLADVSYIKSDGASNIRVSNSSAVLDGIPNDFLNLVYNLNQYATIQLLSLTTPLTDPTPRLKGSTAAVTYSVLPADGSFVGNGGLYTNIINVEGVTGVTGVTGQYFLQENDYTVLSNGSDVHIFDPALATAQVIDKGKIVVIKNISAETSIVVDSQNNTIFDGAILLSYLQSVTLQNNGTHWYVIGRS